jgi:hypothetical protein
MRKSHIKFIAIKFIWSEIYSQKMSGKFVNFLILINLNFILSFATFLSLNGNEWTAINQNQCN